MTKPKPPPPCGTCAFAIPDGDNLWCHGGPPSAFFKLVANMDGGELKQQERLFGQYPPVGKDTIGCAAHSQWRRRA